MAVNACSMSASSQKHEWRYKGELDHSFSISSVPESAWFSSSIGVVIAAISGLGKDFEYGFCHARGIYQTLRCKMSTSGDVMMREQDGVAENQPSPNPVLAGHANGLEHGCHRFRFATPCLEGPAPRLDSGHASPRR